jgi:hypothetical protein
VILVWCAKVKIYPFISKDNLIQTYIFLIFAC